MVLHTEQMKDMNTQARSTEFFFFKISLFFVFFLFLLRILNVLLQVCSLTSTPEGLTSCKFSFLKPEVAQAAESLSCYRKFYIN